MVEENALSNNNNEVAKGKNNASAPENSREIDEELDDIEVLSDEEYEDEDARVAKAVRAAAQNKEDTDDLEDNEADDTEAQDDKKDCDYVPEGANATSKAEVEPMTEDRFEKLNALLEKTAVFSKFISENLARPESETVSDSKGGEEVQAEEEEAEEEQPKKGGRGRKRGKADKTESNKKIKNIMSEKTATATATAKKTKMKQPALITGGELRDYQLQGVNWLISLWENGLNGILADEMGLGKTVQTVSLVAHLVANNIEGPFLIVAPLSTISNWIKEFKRWAPAISVIMYHGSKDERNQLRLKYFSAYNEPRSAKKATGKGAKGKANSKKQQEAEKNKWNVLITSYEISILDRKYLDKFKWKYLIVDEAHRLKNMNCRLINELRRLHTDNRLLLTGTPIQNNLAELWSLLNFLLPEVFDDLSAFQSWFDISDDISKKGGDKQIIMREQENQLITKLHSILRPFMLRRIKTDIDINLPKKKELVLYCSLTPAQKRYYSAIKARDFSGIVSDAKPSSRRLANILMQLRKACNSTMLFQENLEAAESYSMNPSEPATNAKWKQELEESSGKIQLLSRMLPLLRAGGHKVLIFSQMTKMLDLLEDYLGDCCGYKYCRIDGAVKQSDRQKQIEDFNNDPDIFAFLLSTRAGGLGINLTSADTVIIFDSDWNPHMDLQAQDRCHRKYNSSTNILNVVIVNPSASPRCVSGEHVI
eukprot:GEZU01019409.1.p1 GENE.GEZU01019409.1~~GEZU01019409.1.p1  ORF type:complete len:709 (+),score=260.56 GEZU01019409.1:758-2884(+)